MTISSATAGTTLPTPTTHARTRQPTNQLRSRIEPSFRLEVTGQCWPMSVGIGPQSEIPLDILPQAGESLGFGDEEEDDQGTEDKQLEVRQKIGHALIGNAKHSLGNADDAQIQRNGQELDEDRAEHRP